MSINTIALFGEAEKGRFNTAYFCSTLADLDTCLGNPPPESRGLYYAVQALLYQFNLLFFRVREEGFSYQDYLLGLRLLESQQMFPTVIALCLPGVGDQRIIQAASCYCLEHRSLMITNEPDLYDYLTADQMSTL